MKKYLIAIVIIFASVCIYANNSLPTQSHNERNMKTNSKTLNVKKIELEKPYSIDQLNNAMNRQRIRYNKIDVVNWPQYSYQKAEVKFRIAHTGDAICLQYIVKEPYIKASSTEDAGSAPYKDSCVEFFIVPDKTNYYNLELNCIGIGTFAGGAERTGRVKYDQDVMDQIIRRSNVPKDLFEWKSTWTAKEIEQVVNRSFVKDVPANFIKDNMIEWRLDVIIPTSLFSLKEIGDLSQLEATANFYKCGDEMPVKHYLSWNPINLEKPNFHTPQFFGKILFE